MTEFFNVIAEFAVYPKTEDITVDFFNFLQEKYPLQWDNLNKFYGDDFSHDSSPRLCLYGWDDLLQPKWFGLFLQAIKSIWIELSEEDLGLCEYCGEESVLKTEHNIIISYDFGPVVKYYEHFEMDGSAFKEVKCCRQCAAQRLNHIVAKMNPEKETCWI